MCDRLCLLEEGEGKLILGPGGESKIGHKLVCEDPAGFPKGGGRRRRGKAPQRWRLGQGRRKR